MAVYTPASSIGWLDHDSAATERVATLLRSLDEPGTLDELGLGSVRDAFSEMLSPGTSTVQTRLRYFIFIPWIFSRLEAQQVPPANFSRRLREDESRLIDCLRHLGPGQGVIGYNSGRELRRMPSEVYWGGLGSWGLRRLAHLSIAVHGQRAAAIGRLPPERDDDGNPTRRVVSTWAPLPQSPEDFLNGDISFELRAEEAQVLVDHIRLNHPCSLLAVLCGMPAAPQDADYPWDVPTNGLPNDLAEILRHARCFSELTHGPQLVYNVLLARKARKEFGWETDELEARQLRQLRAWGELVVGRHEELRYWADDLSAFWHVLAGNRISVWTQSFVTSVVGRAIANPLDFANDVEAHSHIRNRELQLKSKRARLAHRAALENWNQTPSGGQLDYRWPITKRYLTEIGQALREGA